MSAFSAPAVQRRSVKKPRLGPPDVYPQDAKQKEDELSAKTLKEGFVYSPVTNAVDEYGSARPSSSSYSTSNFTATSISAYFNGVFAKKEEYNTIQDSTKKKPVFNNRDQFFLVNSKVPVGNQKAVVESWFGDLLVSKPPHPLVKKIPVYVKKEDVFYPLFDKDVSYVKAAWYIKLMASYAALQPDKGAKKRQVSDPCMEWTQAVLKNIKDLMSRLSEHCRLVPNDKADAVLAMALPGTSQGPDAQDYGSLYKQFKYSVGLANYLYDQGLLDRNEVCTWLVDMTEKIRASPDSGLMKLLIPCVYYFMTDILQSEILSRKLGATAAKYLSAICSPVARGPAPQKAPQQLLDEALECGHHVVPVRCLITILHTILLQQPGACVWNSLGDDRTTSPLDGSPLDHLPVFPSELPIGAAVDQAFSDLREKVRLKEREIGERSAQVEIHWVLSKKSVAKKIANVWTSLTALEALDRYSFHKSDGRDNMDVLYASVFCSVPPDFSASSENWKSEIEPLVFLLCNWSVSTRRTGLHRGMVIAVLLEKFQAHLRAQMQQGEDTPEGPVAAAAQAFLFQDSLMRYLDEEGPKFDASGQPVDQTAFENLVLLFSELISRNVFSHDAYVCALIATGIISQAGAGRRPAPSNNLGNMVTLESPASQHEQGYMPQMSPGSLSVSTPGSVGYYDNSGMMLGEDYQKRNSVPQSPLSHGLERKAAIPGYLAAMQSAMYPPPHVGMQGSQQHMSSLEDMTPARTPLSADFAGDGYDKPASVSSMTSEPGIAALSPHYFYVLHFPLSASHDVEDSHEANQRAILLFGFGRPREQAHHQVASLQDALQKLFKKKRCYEISSGIGKGHRKDVPRTYSNLRQRFMGLPYFDRHSVSSVVMTTLFDCLNTFLASAAVYAPEEEKKSSKNRGSDEEKKTPRSYIPAVENIIFAMQIMESAFNLRQLLNCVTQLLGILKPIESVLLQKLNQLTPDGRSREPNLCQILLPPVILFCVGMLRKYHCSLLLSREHTVAAFEGLRTIVAGVGLPGDCTSAERCVLAYMNDLYQCCAFLQARYRDTFTGPSTQIQKTIMGKTKPATQGHPESRQTKEFVEAVMEFIQNPHPKSRPSADIVRRLAEPANQHFFVVQSILKVARVRDPDVVNELAIFCAEMTACCSGLTAEWLAAFRAFILTCQKSDAYDDLVRKIEVADVYVHEQIAVFCCVLIARHCIRLEDFVAYVALMTLMMASKQDEDPSRGISGRLATHVIFRLLQGSYGPPDDPSQQPPPVFYLKYSWDRCLLISARRGLGVAPLLAVLKAMLVLSDSDATRDSRAIKKEWSFEGWSYGGRIDNTRPFGSDIEGLSDFARVVLREICQEDTTRECVLKELENLFSTDLLLDPILSMSQTRHLVHLICHPVSQTSGSGYFYLHPDDRPDDKQAIQRILRNVDQWNLRVSWVELRLMLDQNSGAQTGQERSQLVDMFARGIIDSFQQKSETVSQSKKGKVPSTKYELDNGEHVWYLAPLIARLDTSVQIKILKQAISVMENCSWSLKGKEREKLSKSALLLGHPPFISILTTCLTKSLRPDQQEEQREGLLRSLLDQLSQFSKEDRVYSSEDAKLRPLLLDSLSLRLSLTGSLFDIIQKKSNVLQDWTFLLAQLITSGCVDPVGSPDVFITVMDMLTVLIHTAYAEPPSNGVDERKVYGTLVKKIRKEIGEKLIPGVEWIKMLLPLSKKNVDVLAMEPAGVVFDSKGNKINNLDVSDGKQGLQVSCRVKLNPWEILEGFRNPYPLSWAFFQSIRLERKILNTDLQHQLLAWHTHQPPRAIEHYTDAPPAPPDEDPPSDKLSSEEPATSETTSVDTASPRSPRSRQTKPKKAPSTTGKNKRTKSAVSLMGMHGGTVAGAGAGFMAPGPSNPYGETGGMMMGQPPQGGPQWYPAAGQPGMPTAAPQRFHYTHGQGVPQGPGHPMGQAPRGTYIPPEVGSVRPRTKAELQMMLQNRNQQSALPQQQQQPSGQLSFLLSQQQGQRMAMGQVPGQPGQNHPSYMNRQAPGGVGMAMGTQSEAELFQRQQHELRRRHQQEQLRMQAAHQQAQQQQANQAAHGQVDMGQMAQRQGPGAGQGYANFPGGGMVNEHGQQSQQQMQTIYMEQQHHQAQSQGVAGGGMMTVSGGNPGGGQYSVVDQQHPRAMHTQQGQPVNAQGYHQTPMAQAGNINMPTEYMQQPQYHPQQGRPAR